MQPAETYILSQPEPYRSILLHLQVLIEQGLEQPILKYKWAFPCYYEGKKPICYLRQANDYVDVGFWHTENVKQYSENLVSENRKKVKSLRYKALEDVNDEIFNSILKAIVATDYNSFLK